MTRERRRVAVGSDMVHETVSVIVRHLEATGCDVVPCGAAGGAETPWPDVAAEVAQLVATGAVATGVVCCWTGTGVSIAANKVPGVRAALCADPEIARGARRWNDANVLALGLASTRNEDVTAILDAWLDTEDVDPGEAPNIARVSELEQRYRRG